MNYRGIAAGILVTVILLVFTGTIFSETKTMDDGRQAYEQYLDQIISSCFAKSRIADTRSENLREYCERAEMKANFIIRNKERLIEEMRRINLEPKRYKIRLYVNSRFFEKLRNDGL